MSFIRSLEYVLINVEVYWNYYLCLSCLVYKMSFFIIQTNTETHFLNEKLKFIQKHQKYSHNCS